MFLGITTSAGRCRIRLSDEAISPSVLAQIGDDRVPGGFPLRRPAGVHRRYPDPRCQHGVPRLPAALAILARDRFMPSQLRNRGDRWSSRTASSCSRLLAGLLVWVFDAELTHLIQLYVVACSPRSPCPRPAWCAAGSAIKGPNWQRYAFINGLGALTTGVVLVIVTLTKFSRGAWIVILAIPIIVGFFLAVHHHYEKIGRILRERRLDASAEPGNVPLPRGRPGAGDLGRRPLPACGAGGGRGAAVRRAARPLPRDGGGLADLAPRLGELEVLEGGDDHPGRA